MLHIDYISKIEIYSDEWFQARLGKFTSSRINCLMTDEPLGKGAMTYIKHKVGEMLTGQTTAEDEVIEDENTAWGNQYEPEAIQKFGKMMNLQFLVTQKLIIPPNSQFSSTPDALWVKGVAKNEKEYNVRTLEVKCPRKFHKFISYYMCDTPEKVKKENKVYYWQVIDQMLVTTSAIGYLVFYHPQFPEGSNTRIIEFNKMDLWEDFKLLIERKNIAVAEFNKIKSMFPVIK